MSQGSRDEIVGHERDVGGLDRGVAARRAHGDAEARPRQGGRVVDAVADHGDGPYFVTSASTAATLSSGKQLGVDLVDADLARDRLGGRPVVAGEHDQVLDAARLQVSDHRGPLPGAPRRPPRSGRRRAARCRSPRPSGRPARARRPGRHLAGLLAALLEVAVRAEPVRLAAEAADDALALEDAHVVGGRDLDAASRGRARRSPARAGARCGPRARARSRSSSSLCPFNGTTSTTAGSPRVSVPVLSKAMALSPAGFSI